MTISLSARLHESATWLSQKIGSRFAKKAVILGSGFKGFEDLLQDKTTVYFHEIPHMPSPTVKGHGATLVLGHLNNEMIFVLTGRVHMYEGLSAHQIVYPLRLLAHLGLTHVLLTNASGSVNPQLLPGTVVAVKDHINFTGQNCLIGPEARELGEVFLDMGSSYDPEWRAAIQKLDNTIPEGVYAGVLGPSYETPAETKMLGLAGADVVGMSTVQETLAARQLGIKVACLSFVTNMAGGLGNSLDHHDVIRMAQSRSEALRTLVAKSIGVAP
jgi:purine-nucleoside phosphorylase